MICLIKYIPIRHQTLGKVKKCDFYDRQDGKISEITEEILPNIRRLGIQPTDKMVEDHQVWECKHPPKTYFVKKVSNSFQFYLYSGD